MRSTSSIGSRISVSNWSASTRRFAGSGQSNRHEAAGRNRKKNGCCNPSGSCTGNQSAPEPDLCPAQQQRSNRSGSGGERFTRRPPPSRSKRSQRTAPVRSASGGQLPCRCGHHARYRELRSKPVLTMLGPARISRPYFLCSKCHQGQFPADVELDVEDTETSPGVRRMLALVGQEAPFDHGRRQMKLLAG